MSYIQTVQDPERQGATATTLPALTRFQFDAVYQQAVTDVLLHWTREMQSTLARHCKGWNPENFDFQQYLRMSSKRFFVAYNAARERRASSVCDVGGFWGVFALTLHRLGIQVGMTEALQYYSACFDRLFAFIRESGVPVFDFDPFADAAEPPVRADFISAMAVLEHYPHSLKTFMRNMHSMVNRDGHLYLEVPNIAYWPKRIAFLRGVSPASSIEDIFHSDVPYIGHHHEFTARELLSLARLSGFAEDGFAAYDYSLSSVPRLSLFITRPVQTVMSCLFPTTRECLALCCRKLEVLPGASR